MTDPGLLVMSMSFVLFYLNFFVFKNKNHSTQGTAGEEAFLKLSSTVG
jgi:hypothetical protein